MKSEIRNEVRSEKLCVTGGDSPPSLEVQSLRSSERK